MNKRKLLSLAVALTFSASAVSMSLFSVQAVAANKSLSFNKQWTYKHVISGQVSEISAFDQKTNTVWVAGVVGVDVLNAENGHLIKHIDLTAYGFINSVAIHNGIAAFALEAPVDRRVPGSVVFFDTKTLQLAEGTHQVIVGALPDMLKFTQDGSKLLVANEATPNAKADTPYTTPDPEGTVSVIDMATRTVIANAGFAGVAITGENVRNNIGIDFEPEYIAVNEDATKAFVTLQEANAIGVLDLATNQFTEVIGLGLKDFNLSDNQMGNSNFIDPSDEDPKASPVISLRANLVKGLYQPDSVVAYSVRGKTYLVMANEGDTREDETDKKRVKDVASLASSTASDLSRLNISTTDSTPGNIVTFGGRSFSIRDEAGRIVYDSGNLLDAQAIARNIYDDKRSDDKGVEPEGVALLDIGGRTYAFVGLERTKKAAVAVFDITNPTQVSFIDMLVTEGDISPEGLNAYQYKGNFYLTIANEVSNTTTQYVIDKVKLK